MLSSQLTFEEAMNAAMHWCDAWEKGELSDEVISDRVAELLSTREGVRGFFAISLSIDCPLIDRLPDPLLMQLRASYSHSFAPSYHHRAAKIVNFFISQWNQLKF